MFSYDNLTPAEQGAYGQVEQGPTAAPTGADHRIDTADVGGNVDMTISGGGYIGAGADPDATRAPARRVPIADDSDEF